MTVSADLAVAGGDQPVAAPDAVDGPGGDALFVASWELDLSGVQSLLGALAGGQPALAGWEEELVNGARIADLDERAAQVVGAPISREEMIGRSVASFAPPYSWQTLAELIVAVACDRPRHAAQSKRVKSFMLREAWLKVWAAEQPSIPTRMYVTIEGEIADKRSLWAVRASEQRYQRLIQHLPNALLQVDGSALDRIFHKLRDEGVIDLEPYLQEHPELVESVSKIVLVTDANEAAVNLFGATGVEALIGPIDFIHSRSPDNVRRAMLARFLGKRRHSELIKLRTFDGRTIDVQYSITYPTAPERLDVALITLEDVTERLRTEAQLRQLQAEHSRATRIATLGELASSIAHEVNQPLAAISMNAETSLRWLSRDEPNLPKVAQLNERIAASARHASDIVQRIRGMAARQSPECLPVDLNEIVEEALLFVRHDLEAKAIRLTRTYAYVLPKVYGDRVQLQQVIVNLLVNSVQALEQGRSRRRLIELATGLGADGLAYFAIRDNGPGVAPENLDRLFEGFFTTKEDGMGIGLSVCHSIISGHGGTICVANRPNGGAEFRFSLPPIPDEDAEWVPANT